MYQAIRKLLFNFDAEKVHYFAMNALKTGNSVGVINRLIKNNLSSNNHQLQKEVFGLNFPNPVGLAAGFDKNALYLNELEALGFGFVEVGTVTPKPQEGNEKPRLFRLPNDKALINRMGFNNDGVKVIGLRLSKWKSKRPASSKLIVGGNIGKNKVTPNEEAWKDYEICFRELFDLVDYFVVNVSSPNTPGLRELQEKESLRKILSHLQTINKQQRETKPILLKIAPDLTVEQLDDVIDLAMEIKLDGLVACNTSLDRSNLSEESKIISEKIGAGGLSGSPVKIKAVSIVKYIHTKTGGTIPVIGSGGIFTGEDAKQMIKAGASLVQVWTGFIYEGPAIAKNICRTLQA
ncbi:MAG: quinone-dependent dihydroorotate dehydrogenase [Flavitalea sp.]